MSFDLRDVWDEPESNNPSSEQTENTPPSPSSARVVTTVPHEDAALRRLLTEIQALKEHSQRRDTVMLIGSLITCGLLLNHIDRLRYRIRVLEQRR